MRFSVRSRRCGASCVVLLLALVSACLPPTRTGRTCQSHADCEFDALWKPLEEAVAPDFRCDETEGICVPGNPPADAGPDDAGPADGGTDDAGVDDAGLSDAGLDDAGLSDAGIDDAGIDDAGIDDAGTSNPPLTVNVGACLIEVDAEDAPITGLLVARVGGPSVTARIGDLGLIGLVPLCVVPPEAGGIFQGLGTNIIFTPGGTAIDELVAFAAGGGGPVRLVRIVVVEPSDVRMWNPTAVSDDVDDASNWIPTGTPVDTDVVYVPDGIVSPTFKAAPAYARRLLVEPNVEIRLTGGLGLGVGAYVAGRATTLGNGRLVFGGDEPVAEDVFLGGRAAGIEVRGDTDAFVVAPLDVERGVVVTTGTAEGSRPELNVARPVWMRVGGELTVGSVTAEGDFGRILVEHEGAVVEVFGNASFRTAAGNPTNLKQGQLRAWSAFTCRSGAAVIDPDFTVRFPGEPGSLVDGALSSACPLGIVRVDESRTLPIEALLGTVQTDVGRLRVEGTVIAATTLDVDACCLGPRGILAAAGDGPTEGFIYVDGTLLVGPGSCVSADPAATYPGSDTVCATPAAGLCASLAACTF
jgi:hypothetical protein